MSGATSPKREDQEVNETDGGELELTTTPELYTIVRSLRASTKAQRRISGEKLTKNKNGVRNRRLGGARSKTPNTINSLESEEEINQEETGDQQLDGNVATVHDRQTESNLVGQATSGEGEISNSQGDEDRESSVGSSGVSTPAGKGEVLYSVEGPVIDNKLGERNKNKDEQLPPRQFDGENKTSDHAKSHQTATGDSHREQDREIEDSPFDVNDYDISKIFEDCIQEEEKGIEHKQAHSNELRVGDQDWERYLDPNVTNWWKYSSGIGTAAAYPSVGSTVQQNNWLFRRKPVQELRQLYEPTTGRNDIITYQKPTKAQSISVPEATNFQSTRDPQPTGIYQGITDSRTHTEPQVTINPHGEQITINPLTLNNSPTYQIKILKYLGQNPSISELEIQSQNLPKLYPKIPKREIQERYPREKLEPTAPIESIYHKGFTPGTEEGEPGVPDGMAYLAPTPFKGLSSENPVQWIKFMSYWITTTYAGRGKNLKRALDQVAVFLADTALEWFETLTIMEEEEYQAIRDRGGNIECIKNWVDFETAFIDRFKRDANDRLAEITGLMELKQAETQTVEQYITLVKKQAAIVGAKPEEIYMIVINGLRSDLKRDIMMSEPRTVEDILRKGRLVERYPREKTFKGNDEKILSGISAMALDRRTEETRGRVSFREPSVRETRTYGQNGNNRGRYDRSLSPARRYNGNYRGNYGEDNRRDQSRERYNRGDNEFRNDRRYSNDRNQQTRNYGNQEYNQRERNNRRYVGNAGQNINCGNCGWQHVRNNCPAYGKICTNCKRTGHWARMCRGGFRPGVQNYRDQGETNGQWRYSGSQQLAEGSE